MRSNLSGHGLNVGRRKLLLSLVGLYVALLPYPVTIDLANGSQIRTGPSDVVLFVLLLFAMDVVTVPRLAWSGWHSAVALIPLISGLGVGLSGGELTVAVVAAKVIGLLALFAGYVVVISVVSTWDDVRYLARIFVRSVVWLNLVATALFVLRLPFLGLNPEPLRLSGLNPDPNAYGSMLVVALALAAPTFGSGRAITDSRIERWGVALLPFSILLTNSRSAWIALGVVVIGLIVSRPRAGLGLALAAGAVLALAALLLPPDLTSEQLALAGRGSSSRVEILTETWSAFWSQPLVGIGLGQFQAVHGYIIHSTPAWWLGEFGIVGFVTIVGFLGTFFRWGRHVVRVQIDPQRTMVLGLMIAFTSMAVFSLGIEALYQRWWWLTMGLLASARCITARDIARTRAAA